MQADLSCVPILLEKKTLPAINQSGLLSIWILHIEIINSSDQKLYVTDGASAISLQDEATLEISFGVNCNLPRHQILPIPSFLGVEPRSKARMSTTLPEALNLSGSEVKCKDTIRYDVAVGNFQNILCIFFVSKDKPPTRKQLPTRDARERWIASLSKTRVNVTVDSVKEKQ